jgi:hypothetical protein
LFVHLLSGQHTVTGSIGPNRIMSSGGLRYWKDGRDAAHPEFSLSLKVNFKSGIGGERFEFRFIGSEGVIDTSMSSPTLTKAQQEAEPGYSDGR